MRVRAIVLAAFVAIGLWLAYRSLQKEDTRSDEAPTKQSKAVETKRESAPPPDRPANEKDEPASEPAWVHNSPARIEEAPSDVPSVKKIFDQEAKTIEPKELGDAFETGERRSIPSDTVREAILLSGKRILYPVFKVCVDSDGAVDDVSVIVTSGYPSYDEQMLEQIRAWRYAPIVDENNVAIAVCSSLVLPQVVH